MFVMSFVLSVQVLLMLIMFLLFMIFSPFGHRGLLVDFYRYSCVRLIIIALPVGVGFYAPANWGAATVPDEPGRGYSVFKVLCLNKI